MCVVGVEVDELGVMSWVGAGAGVGVVGVEGDELGVMTWGVGAGVGVGGVGGVGFHETFQI